MVLDVLEDLLLGDLLAVLHAHEDGVDAAGTALAVVFDGDLGLAVRASPAQRAIAPEDRQPAGELMGHLNRRGHQLGRLVAREAEHHSLVAGAAVIDTLRDVGRLLVDADQHATGLPVDAVLGAGVADLLDRLADEAGDVDIGLGGDLPEDQDRAGAQRGLARDPAERILAQDSVEDGVTDLIGNLVRMPLGDRLRGEEAMARCGHGNVPSTPPAATETPCAPPACSCPGIARS